VLTSAQSSSSSIRWKAELHQHPALGPLRPPERVGVLAPAVPLGVAGWIATALGVAEPRGVLPPEEGHHLAVVGTVVHGREARPQGLDPGLSHLPIHRAIVPEV
jgi:hypothetical protein